MSRKAVNAKLNIRVRMGPVHTWVGLILSGLIFAIFWTGTLSVFDKEIDRWMMPDTRINLMKVTSSLSVDKDIIQPLSEQQNGAAYWTIVLPRERIPYVIKAASYKKPRRHVREYFHPVTLAPLTKANRPNASSFIYPFHHNLTLRKDDLGAWLVGGASIAMLCLLVSGIVIHRRIFTDFFSLRLFRKFSRANLDLHNLTGVVLLPFTLVITLSGLIIVQQVYFPQLISRVYQQAISVENSNKVANEKDAQRLFSAKVLGHIRESASGEKGHFASIEQMISEAESDWGKGGVYLVRVNHPGDTNSSVVFRRHSDDSVTKSNDHKRFNTMTGEPKGSFTGSQAVGIWNFISGMHYIQFDHWPLRWLYFFAGLGSCLLIATGLVHWTIASNKNNLNPPLNVALMNAHNIAVITGIIAATGVFLLTNRVRDISPYLDTVMGDKAEIYAFFSVWLLSLLHALLSVLQDRSYGYLRAWTQQCGFIAVVAVFAVILNWVGTGDGLIKTVFTDTYWPVAATDLVLLISAASAFWTSVKLRAHYQERF